MQISQALFNILINAFEATLGIEQPWVKLEFRDHGDEVEISVLDNGRGIKDGIRSRVLEPFFTTKEVGEGAGLGLSTSRGLVESHGGRLELSETHPFTRFTITLPGKTKVRSAS